MCSGCNNSIAVIKKRKASGTKGSKSDEVNIKIEPSTAADVSSPPAGPQPGSREFEIQRLKALRYDDKSKIWFIICVT
jgi:hypothetical protein